MQWVFQVQYSLCPRARNFWFMSLSWLRASSSSYPPTSSMGFLSITGKLMMSANPSDWVRKDLLEEPNGWLSTQAASCACSVSLAGRVITLPVHPAAPWASSSFRQTEM